MGSFGVYVHIPYCLQICTYCDFVKFEKKDLPPTDRYVSLLEQEIASRGPRVQQTIPSSIMHSLYFGGGTPSLLSPSEILSVIQALEKQGFQRASGAEVTLEVNPGTLTGSSLDAFLEMGITRFSVGAQTFDERFLSVTGRKHSVSDTIATLELLRDRGAHFSFDLLFGLPGQHLADVGRDVRRALEYGPKHLSAYCLTLPEKHRLNKGRAPDDEQAQMFDLICDDLAVGGLVRYEVSNFAVPGFESRHNLLYWSDKPYWGIGIGAHSYLPVAPWGVRFWNPPTVRSWELEMARTTGVEFWREFEPSRVEPLQLHQAITDFTHTALRSTRGLIDTEVLLKFSSAFPDLPREIERRALPLVQDGLLLRAENPGRWLLSKAGHALADRVFEPLTFLKDEV